MSNKKTASLQVFKPFFSSNFTNSWPLISSSNLSLSCACNVGLAFVKLISLKTPPSKQKIQFPLEVRYIHCSSQSLFHGAKFFLKSYSEFLTDVIRLEFRKGLYVSLCMLLIMLAAISHPLSPQNFQLLVFPNLSSATGLNPSSRQKWSCCLSKTFVNFVNSCSTVWEIENRRSFLLANM